MKSLPLLSKRFDWLWISFGFFRKHLFLIMSLGLVAALGRVTQLGGFGEINSALYIALEVIIESARVLLFLYVLGFSNISKGILRIKNFVTEKVNRKRLVRAAKEKLAKEWPFIFLNVAGFLLIASAFNYLIDLTVYETCFYLSLQQDGILSPTSSEWTMLLFLKNLSVVPFTLVFDAIFLLWVTNKLRTNAG